MDQKLDALEQAELVKFPGDDERLVRYQADEQIWHDFASEFKGNGPEEWKFYDDQIPAWFEEYTINEAERLGVEKEEAENRQIEI
jgi:hypothetical protein